MKHLAALILPCACTFTTTGMSAGATETTPSSTDPLEISTTTPVETSNPTTTGAPDSLSESTATTSSPDTGVAFRFSTLNIIDPHFFLSNPNDPMLCSADVTAGLNTVVNNDIAEGGFNLVIYFEELAPGAEMRLFQGDCTDPGDGSPWTCVKQDGVQQTVFDTEEVLAAPCREFDPAVFQPANLPMISDPLPTCVRTMPQDFSVAVSNSAAPLFLREAQIVVSPDSTTDPKTIPTGLLYGFLPRVAAENTSVEVPLTGTVTVWSVIDVMCAADFPDQLPSVDEAYIDAENVEGVWMAINFTAEHVNYTP